MLNFQDLAKITVEAIQENKEEVGILPEPSLPIKSTAKTEEELRKRQIKEHVSDLFENSSLHGVPYIYDKRHPIRRVIWFFITLTAFIYAMLKVYESTVNFLNYPFYTVRMRQYVDEMEFPAVSFCNSNDMRMSVINGTKVDIALLDPSKRKNVTAKEMALSKAAAHNLDEMLVDCNFNGQKCTTKNFTSFNWIQGDRCFTFNSGKEGHKLQSLSGAGVERSLTLTINLQHYDYYRDRTDAGVHLILHGQDDTPVRMLGPMLSPGYTTYIQVEKNKIINLKSPYKTHCGSLNLKYFKGYSMDICWLEQLTDYLKKHCQCKRSFMPGNIPICNLTMLRICLWPRWEKFEKEKLSNCPLPCEIDSYNGNIISRALFPSSTYAERLFSKVKHLPHMKNLDIKDTKRFMRDNFLRIKIYYEDMSYELLEQKPSYGTLVWLGDVGGQIGLFIGAGAMSYFEFVDCIGLVIYSRFFQSFKAAPPV